MADSQDIKHMIEMKWDRRGVQHIDRLSRWRIEEADGVVSVESNGYGRKAKDAQRDKRERFLNKLRGRKCSTR